MRQLTLFPRMGEGNFTHLEEIAKTKIPSLSFREFMIWNAGLSHYERYFESNDVLWEVQRYEPYIEMYKSLQGFIRRYALK